MKVIKFCILFLSLSSFTLLNAQRGKDSAKTVSAANTIVNEYTNLSVDASAGNTIINVAGSTLNTNNRFGANLAAGDLVMIYQARGAWINGSSSGTTGTPNDTTWGRIDDYYYCGVYEFAEVRSVPSLTSIELDCSLQHDYKANTNFFKCLVVRVPRYTSLTINNGGVLTCDDWDGTLGGILAVEVEGNTTINSGGIVDATGKGFRGGSLVGDNATTFGVSEAASTDNTMGAEKGEGIVGYQSMYDFWGGRYGRNPAGNGGGGGCAHNAGGGGGANAIPNGGSLYNWKGWGIPDLSGTSYSTAWGLDNAAIPALTDANSSGGGRGGYSFSSKNQNAITDAPGTSSPSTLSWGGDYRNPQATGLGGRPLNYATGRIFMGGGGGAGDQNNSAGGEGGDGGGIIYIMVYGNISKAGAGTATIQSNGDPGKNAQNGTQIPSGLDGAGGGGAGGVIILNAVGTIDNTLTLNTNGGNGGNQVISPTLGNTETEGPGGGGGGGYIAVSNGTPATSSAGGNNGTTNSPALSEFTPNGALKGCSGTTNGTITNFTISASGVTICSGNTASLTASLGGNPAGGTTITWYDAEVAGNQLGTGSSYTTPTLTATTTYYVGTCPGTYRIPVVVTVNTTTAVSITPVSPVCTSSAPFSMSATPSGGTWSGTGITNAANGTFDPSSTGTGTFVVTYSIGGSCPGTGTTSVVVNSGGANTAITPVSPVCTNTSAFNMSAATTGGTWSGTGITDVNNGTFNPATAGTGTFTVTYSISGACASSSTTSVVVNTVPNASQTAAGPFCANASAVNLVAATGGGTWSGTGITNGSSGTFDPAVSGAGSFAVTYSIGGGCPSSSTQTITVNSVPNSSITPVSPICTNTAAFNMAAATGGGTWSGTGITNASSGTFNPATAGAGTFTVTYSISGTCPSTSTTSVVVNAVPNASQTAAGPFCANASAVNLVAATGGGTWSGTGITNASSETFDPAVAGPGSFAITYSIGGTCPSSSTQTITVNSVPNSSITPVSSVCTSVAAFNMTAATGGGTWSGTGITNASNGTFDPATAGAGTFAVTYSISGSCPSTSTTSVVVNPMANSTINPQGAICSTAAAFNLTAVTSGGTWGGSGITDVNNGTFDPAVSGIGSFVITYSISGSCGSASTITIQVNSTLSSTINAVSPVCTNTAAFDMTAANSGGTWSGTGITNTSNGTFDPATAGSGTFTITYSISGSCGSTSTQTVSVIAASNGTINPVTPVCDGDPAFNLIAAQGGGTWSGTGITDVNNGTFDPAVSGAGTFTVTYSISGSCPATGTTSVVVNHVPDATISNVFPLCSADSAILLAAATMGGTWSGTGITNASNGVFDPTVSGAGTFTVTYAFTGSCPASDTEVISVIQSSDAAINTPPSFCFSGSAVNLSSVQSGGAWSGTGITNASAGTFDPAVSGIGNFMVYYTIGSSCGDVDSVNVTVSNSFNATINSIAPMCSDGNSKTLTASDPGGTWSGTGITSASAGIFDPKISGPGTFTVTYTIAGNCGSSDTAIATVNASPDATIADPGTLCASGGTVTLTAAQGGGTWSGTGITNTTAGIFDPAASGAGTFTVIYTISGVCQSDDTIFVNVINTISSTINSAGPFCTNDASATLTAANSGGAWSGSGITNATAGTFDPAVAGAGTSTITYSISGACGTTSTVSVVVNQSANATITSVQTSFCQGAAAVNLTATQSGGVWSGTGITNAGNGTFNPSGAGVFPLVYTISGACGDDDTLTVTVNAAPAASITNAPLTGCAPLCINFSAANAPQYSWDFADGSTDATQMPYHCFTTAGTYMVHLTTTSGSCSAADSVLISVTATPTADFTLGSGNVVAPGTTINFTNTSSSAFAYYWGFGDPSSAANDSSSAVSPSHTFAATGSYCIKLIARAFSGCSDTTTQCILVAENANIVVPNIFTPNGDGTNETFTITSTGLDNLQCVIFDRWGLKLFEFNGVTGFWDGTASNGKKAVNGTYYYLINYTAQNGKTGKAEGFVQLIGN